MPYMCGISAISLRAAGFSTVMLLPYVGLYGSWGWSKESGRAVLFQNRSYLMDWISFNIDQLKRKKKRKENQTGHG